MCATFDFALFPAVFGYHPCWGAQHDRHDFQDDLEDAASCTTAEAGTCGSSKYTQGPRVCDELTKIEGYWKQARRSEISLRLILHQLQKTNAKAETIAQTRDEIDKALGNKHAIEKHIRDMQTSLKQTDEENSESRN